MYSTLWVTTPLVCQLSNMLFRQGNTQKRRLKLIDVYKRQNLYYEVRKKDEDIDKDIIKFIKAHEGKTGIVYCLSLIHI